MGIQKQLYDICGEKDMTTRVAWKMLTYPNDTIHEPTNAGKFYNCRIQLVLTMYRWLALKMGMVVATEKRSQWKEAVFQQDAYSMDIQSY